MGDRQVVSAPTSRITREPCGVARFRLTGIAEPPDTSFAKHSMRADMALYWFTGSRRKAASKSAV
jgi:hypothetical protein